MKRTKKMLLILLILFIAIQFIQPEKNESSRQLATDLTKIYKVPDSVLAVLKVACYDCHSNNTRYPWYAHIQPVAWMMANHITEGKEKMNFSEFGSYSKRRQASKLKGIADQIKDDEMPLTSYKLMHNDEGLSEAEKKFIIGWALQMSDSLSVHN